jgi:hypothetical protein
MFDRDSMRLSIGERSTVVPDLAAGNEAVLRNYLALVADVRGTPIGSGIEVRHDDVVVLAEILDLSDADLDKHLSRLLGVSANDAAEVHRRLRRHHAFAAAFAAALGSVALLTAPNVSAANPMPAKTATVALTPEEVPHTVPAVAPNTPPPAANEAPTPPPPPAPTPHASPTSPDDVQIGDALVIERGTQPADPNTKVGDAVTYER